MADKLFEDRRPGCFTYAYLYPSLLQVHSGASRKEILDLCLKMEFMLNGECYEEGMEKICRAALSPEERTAVFYHFSLYWSDFSGKDFTRYFEEVNGFRWCVPMESMV